MKIKQKTGKLTCGKCGVPMKEVKAFDGHTCDKLKKFIWEFIKRDLSVVSLLLGLFGFSMATQLFKGWEHWIAIFIIWAVVYFLQGFMDKIWELANK